MYQIGGCDAQRKCGCGIVIYILTGLNYYRNITGNCWYTCVILYYLCRYVDRFKVAEFILQIF